MGGHRSYSPELKKMSIKQFILGLKLNSIQILSKGLVLLQSGAFLNYFRLRKGQESVSFIRGEGSFIIPSVN